MIAASTLLSFDVYRHYFAPGASSRQVVKASRFFIVFWAIFSASLASIFKAVGIVNIFVTLDTFILFTVQFRTWVGCSIFWA